MISKIPLITFLLIILSQALFGQTLNKIQREYFVLGTLDDYMGRQLDPRDKNLLDSYDATQGPLVNVIDSVLKIDYPVSDYKVERYTDTAGHPLSFKIFSKILSEKFNGYYDFESSGSTTSDNDPELDNKPILMGKLKQDIFRSTEDKLAFLAGVYVRYGFPNDTAYEIAIPNGPYKSSICYKLLKDMNCNPAYIILKDHIPVGHLLYFHPSPQVKAYLEKFMPLRKKLYDSLLAAFKQAESDYKKQSKQHH